MTSIAGVNNPWARTRPTVGTYQQNPPHRTAGSGSKRPVDEDTRDLPTVNIVRVLLSQFDGDLFYLFVGFLTLSGFKDAELDTFHLLRLVQMENRH